MLTVLCGDAIEQLLTLPDESVQCCVTSPPFWGLRDYGHNGQLGLEKTPEEYMAKMVAVFREVRRVLRKDGTLWLNLGDSYAQQRGGRSEGSHDGGVGRGDAPNNGSVSPPPGLKPKDLCGIPWRVAFALQADGWWLRSDIIWAKPNPMPESVTDRPTKSHEYLFLMTKSANYFYDAEGIREPSVGDWRDSIPGREGGPGQDRRQVRYKTPDGWDTTIGNGGHGSFHKDGREHGRKGYEHKRDKTGGLDGHSGNVTSSGKLLVDRNKRSVWTVATAPYPEAHFATYPPDLIKPCIMAGSRVGDTVLDPFAGSGTTGMVALELGRKAVLIELNPSYVKLIEQRCNVTMGLALA